MNRKKFNKMISKNNKLYHSKIRKKMNHKKFNKMKFLKLPPENSPFFLKL